MLSSASEVRQDPVALPLSQTELAYANSVAMMLRASLVEVIRSVPSTARKIRSFSDYLGIDQNLAQRTLAAADYTKEQLHSPQPILLRAPGVSGLRLLHKACKSRRLPGNTLRQLSEAIDLFEKLICDLAKSHAGLRARLLAASVDTNAPASSEQYDSTQKESALRRQLYQNAAELLGTQTETHACSVVFRFTPQPLPISEMSLVVSYRDIRSRSGGSPIPISIGYHYDDEAQTRSESVAHRKIIVQGGELIEELSSANLPMVIAQGEHANSISHVLDPALLHEHGPINMSIFSRRPPISVGLDDELFFDRVAVRIRTPTKRLVVDSFLHRDLPPISEPVCNAYIFSEMPSDLQRIWFERLPGTSSVTTLGSAKIDLLPEAWEGQRRANSILFERNGWNPSDFIAYRYQIDYPLWGATYILSHEYGKLRDRFSTTPAT